MADKASKRSTIISVSDDNAEYLRKTILDTLNSDPEVKAVFRPDTLGMKAGKGVYVVVMANGAIYRMLVKFSVSENSI